MYNFEVEKAVIIGMWSWCFAGCVHHNSRCCLEAKSVFFHRSTRIIHLSSCLFSVTSEESEWLIWRFVNWRDNENSLLNCSEGSPFKLSHLLSWWTCTFCAAAVLVIFPCLCSAVGMCVIWRTRQWNRHTYAKIDNEMILFWHWIQGRYREGGTICALYLSLLKMYCRFFSF